MLYIASHDDLLGKNERSDFNNTIPSGFNKKIYLCNLTDKGKVSDIIKLIIDELKNTNK